MSDLISIVLPVHNELLNLRSLIESWNSELKKISSIEYEFVIVEDGSTDGTKELIEELEKKFPIINLSSEKKRGYSQAVLDGIKASNGDYILCTDRYRFLHIPTERMMWRRGLPACLLA